MNMSLQNTLKRPAGAVSLFVLRRALRFGSATRRDVLDAFAVIGTTKATLAMDDAAARWPDALERTGKAVRRRDGGAVPPEAAEAQLVECLENGWLEFRHTGLRPEELPVRRVQWTHNLPKRPGTLSGIVAAILGRRALRIRYVGLRRGETARWRLVLPAGLERMGDQWRVVAQDLEAEGFPLKTFVLPRILEADAVETALPRGFRPAAVDDPAAPVPVCFHPLLNADQREVLAHELGITDDHVALPGRGAFEFLRRFSDQPPSEDAVWPPIFRMEE